MQARAVASEGNEVPQAPLPCGRGSAKRTKYARISLIGLHSYDLITSMSCTRLLPRGGVPRKRDDRICQAICCPIPLDVYSEAFGIVTRACAVLKAFADQSEMLTLSAVHRY